MELIKRFKWPILGVGAVVLVVGFLLFRPDKLFIDDRVDESLADVFPVAAAASDTETTEAPTTTTTTTEAPATDGDSDEAPAETTTTTTTTTEAPEPEGPQIINTGEFFGIDHSAEGTAAIYEQDGTFVLRFEDNTDIQNGPDLFVWLIEGDNYDSPGNFINLGKIKGNVGGQNYVLPAEYDPEVHTNVLIWCERFSTPFAAAELV